MFIIPTYMGGCDFEGLQFKVSLGKKKFTRPHLNRIVYTSRGQGSCKKQDPISKITKAERAEGVAEAVEYLPSKSKVLSSNPTTAKKEKRKVHLHSGLKAVKLGQLNFLFLLFCLFKVFLLVC
jgi:hypothetical protein